jgi:hypothetical protein
LRLAGYLGLDPRPWTFRELFIMGEGKRAEDWNHTSSLLAFLGNCHRNPKKGKPFVMDQFHPYLSKKRQQKSEGMANFFGVTKAMFRHDHPELTGPEAELKRTTEGKSNGRVSQ